MFILFGSCHVGLVVTDSPHITENYCGSGLSGKFANVRIYKTTPAVLGFFLHWPYIPYILFQTTHLIDKAITEEARAALAADRRYRQGTAEQIKRRAELYYAQSKARDAGSRRSARLRDAAQVNHQ